MDLTTLTPDQHFCVTCLDKPLFVAAGAGSGKTFTLTQRICYALLLESGPALDSVDQVLAITFTNKAAEEIKARVRATLRKEGLLDEALKVDGAWISTIHGMCSRILKTHALELGIDPDFRVLDELEARMMLEDAIQEILGGDAEVAGDPYAALKAEFVNAGGDSLTDMVYTLLNVAAGTIEGLSTLRQGPVSRSAGELARAALCHYENAADFFAAVNPSKSSEAGSAEAAEACERIAALLRSGLAGGMVGYTELASNLQPIKFGRCGSKEARDELKMEYDLVVDELRFAMGGVLLEQLIELARRVERGYEQRKQAAFALDNNDLVRGALLALMGHPEIAEQYENRFKLVMVDEFQDTDQMQVDLISRFAGTKLERLCTVGDVQQSIYRFRGSDVSVFAAMKDTMMRVCDDAQSAMMSKNFRSHEDVLHLADAVFPQPESFGAAFMSLAPHAERSSKLAEGGKRVQFAVARAKHLDDARVRVADMIAERFAELRDLGQDPGDMVILLRSMTNATVYADALRAHGMDCAVTAGSVFGSLPEAHMVMRLLQVIENRQASSALYEVLTGPLFHLDDNDMLLLGTKRTSTNAIARRNLHEGLAAILAGEAVQETASIQVSSRLQFAAQVLDDAWSQVASRPANLIVRHVVEACGWLQYLEGQGSVGMASAAVVLKALRIIDKLAADGAGGIASLSAAFTAFMESSPKESPGALVGSAAGIVRIMTIHASKGLEFPVVAVGEMGSGRIRTSTLMTTRYAGEYYASLNVGSRTGQGLKMNGSRGCWHEVMDGYGPDYACTKAELASMIAEIEAGEERAEAQRLLYVALTRATDAVVVAAADSKTSPMVRGPLGTLVTALFPDGEVPAGHTEVPFGGTQPAYVDCEVLVEPDADELPAMPAEDEEAGVRRISVPVFTPTEQRPVRAGSFFRADMFSYSSLGHGTAAVTDAASIEESDPDEAPVQVGQDVDMERESTQATAFGELFHLLAEYAVKAGRLPTEQVIRDACVRAGAHEETYLRLLPALDRWFSSDLRLEVLSFAKQQAEVPFLVHVGDRQMEGEIDLLATNGLGEPCLIIDYKTGGKDSETPDELQEKHRLQAECYALAVLRRGFPAVDLAFVRVERLDAAAPGQPQVVRYHFDAGDASSLERAIAARAGARIDEALKG